MAQQTLNTASSIVDFLKSQGKPSDFTSRQNLYTSSGLGGAFGDYRGTAEQNVALLNRVRTTTPAPATPTLPPLQPTGPTPEGLIKETTPTAPFDPAQAARDLTEQARKDAGAEQKELTLDLAGEATRAQETLERGVAGLKTGAEAAISALGLKGEQLTERAGEQFAAAGLFRSGKREKSQAQIAQEVATKQTAARTKLGEDLYGKFSDFEKQFGTKFLEELSIPEAQQFVQLPVPVRGIVMKNYQDAVVKAEEKAQKSAVDTLDKLGYVVLGGQIVQKPSEARAAAAEIRAAAKAEAPAKPTIREYVVGGRRVRDLIDPQTGQVIESTDLGDAGEIGAKTKKPEIEPSSGFASYDVETDFRERAVELRRTTKDINVLYKDLRDTYSPSEITDDAIKKFLGIQEAEPSPESTASNWLIESTLRAKASKEPGAQSTGGRSFDPFRVGGFST